MRRIQKILLSTNQQHLGRVESRAALLAPELDIDVFDVIAIKRIQAGLAGSTTTYRQTRVHPKAPHGLSGSTEQALIPAVFAGAIESAWIVQRAEPAEVIADAAERIDADLILAAGNSRPRFPSWVRSSRNMALIRLCRSPILLVHGEPCDAYRTVVVAIDFSLASLAAARTAVLIAPTARFVFVYAYGLPEELMMRELDLPRSVLEAYRGRAFAAGRARLDEFIELYLCNMSSAAREARAGQPHTVVADCVHRHNANLLVMGRGATYPRSRLWSSNVMHKLMDDPSCDILVGASRFVVDDASGLAV